MLLTVQAVIFDMDGLMIDSEPIYKKVWRAACREHGFELSDAQHDNLKGRGRKAALLEVQILARSLNIELDLDRFLLTLQRHEAACFGSEPPQAKRGIEEILSFLEREEILRGVATSAHTEVAKRQLGALNLTQRFHTIVGGDQVQRGKPFPDIFVEAQLRLGVDDPAKCLVLEDSEHGVEGAKAAGMHVIRIPDGIRKDLIEKSRADLLVDSLLDVMPYLRPF